MHAGYRLQIIIIFIKKKMAVIRISLVCCMVLVTGLNSYCQKNPAKTTDSLLALLKKSSRDTSLVNTLLQLGNYYLQLTGEKKSDLDRAMFFFQQASRLSDDLHSPEWHCKVIPYIGMYYFEEGNPEIGKKLLQEAISYYRQKGLKSQEAYLWEQLGNYLYYNGKKRYRPDESLDCYSRSVNLYEASGDIFKAMQAAALKTAIYLARGEYDEIERTYITVHNGYKRINYHGENDIAALEWLIYIANSKSEFYTELSFALEILDNLNKYPKDFSDSRKEKFTIVFQKYIVP